MSNYTRGLTILDITETTSPTAVGRLDTYPASDGTMFNGAWGAYPFFWSGNIAISDIDSGFYMVADRTRDVGEGTLDFGAASYPGIEGQRASIVVERVGGTSGAVSVDYEILHATADADDYRATGGRLDWAAGDASIRTIDIDIVNDGVPESLERLIIRLINPTGGATLGDLNTTSAWLSDPGATAAIGFLDAEVTVQERGFAKAVAVVQRTGTAVGAVSVDIDTLGDADGTDIAGDIPATLSWEDGDASPKNIEFDIVDDGIVESTESITLTLANPSGAGRREQRQLPGIHSGYRRQQRRAECYRRRFTVPPLWQHGHTGWQHVRRPEWRLAQLLVAADRGSGGNAPRRLERSGELYGAGGQFGHAATVSADRGRFRGVVRRCNRLP